jgi:hypothetical protein
MADSLLRLLAGVIRLLELVHNVITTRRQEDLLFAA